MRKVPGNAGSNESRWALAEVVANGVVAAYIHEISDRHDAPPAAAPERSNQRPASDGAVGFD